MTDSCRDGMNAAFELLDGPIERGHGQDCAVLEPGRETLTYCQLRQTANQLARRFAAAGVRRGERVCLLLPDGQELVAAFLGCLRLGAVAVPLNCFISPDQLSFCLEDTQARLLVTHTQFRELLPAATEKVHSVIASAGAEPANENACPVPPDSPVPCETIFVDADSWQEQPVEFDCVAMNTAEDAFWLYTSGSTGNPKAVVHGHGAIRACLRGYGPEILHISSRDRVYSTSKLFFAYGLGNSLLFPLSVGASAVLVGGRASEAMICDTVRQYQPTLFFSVPTLYSRLLRHGVPRAPFAAVRMCISAGEALPAAVAERWQAATGQVIYDGIGATETMHIFCSNRVGDVRPGTLGRPVKGYQISIRDEQQRDVEPGETGYLHVRGASLTTGYWDRQHATTRALPGGWLRTGDVFRQDDGYYSFAGRSDDCFKSSGQWVSPVTIEGVLLAQPGVLEAAVIAGADAEGLLRPQAYVVAAPAAGDEVQAIANLREQLLERLQSLPKHMRPQTIAFVTQFPRTATGKIARQQLRLQHEQTRRAEPNRTAPESPERSR